MMIYSLSFPSAFLFLSFLLKDISVIFLSQFSFPHTPAIVTFRRNYPVFLQRKLKMIPLSGNGRRFVVFWSVFQYRVVTQGKRIVSKKKVLPLKTISYPIQLLSMPKCLITCSAMSHPSVLGIFQTDLR